jgi:hypothetical protein
MINARDIAKSAAKREKFPSDREIWFDHVAWVEIGAKHAKSFLLRTMDTTHARRKIR